MCSQVGVEVSLLYFGLGFVRMVHGEQALLGGDLCFWIGGHWVAVVEEFEGWPPAGFLKKSCFIFH